MRVVAAVIKEDDRIFATSRGYGEYKGWWEFPGGKIEDGETLEQALIREIREELTVEISVGDLIKTVEYDYPSFHLSMVPVLAQIIKGNYHLDPFEEYTLFLFCGRRGDRIKALLWEGTGFLLLYKRFENGSLSWPRNPNEVAGISKHEFRLLLQGLNPIRPKVRSLTPQAML